MFSFGYFSNELQLRSFGAKTSKTKTPKTKIPKTPESPSPYVPPGAAYISLPGIEGDWIILIEGVTGKLTLNEGLNGGKIIFVDTKTKNEYFNINIFLPMNKEIELYDTSYDYNNNKLIFKFKYQLKPTPLWSEEKLSLYSSLSSVISIDIPQVTGKLVYIGEASIIGNELIGTLQLKGLYPYLTSFTIDQSKLILSWIGKRASEQAFAPTPGLVILRPAQTQSSQTAQPTSTQALPTPEDQGYTTTISKNIVTPTSEGEPMKAGFPYLGWIALIGIGLFLFSGAKKEIKSKRGVKK